jgi:hypothetical protein
MIRVIAGLILAFIASVSPALAQSTQVSAGGFTREACSNLTVTASSAYTTGNEVGALITLTTAFRALTQGAPDYGGIIQSIRLTSKSVQTATFNAYQFISNPSNSTWTDKTAPAINALDVTKVRIPIVMSTAYSGLGTHTVYGADLIGRAHVGASQADYWVLTVTGTPTFTAASDLQFCVTYLLD